LVSVKVERTGIDRADDDLFGNVETAEQLVNERVVATAVLDHDVRLREGELYSSIRFKRVRVLGGVVDDGGDLDEVAPDLGGDPAVDVGGGNDRDAPFVGGSGSGTANESHRSDGSGKDDAGLRTKAHGWDFLSEVAACAANDIRYQ